MNHSMCQNVRQRLISPWCSSKDIACLSDKDIRHNPANATRTDVSAEHPERVELFKFVNAMRCSKGQIFSCRVHLLKPHIHGRIWPLNQFLNFGEPESNTIVAGHDKTLHMQD